LSFRFYYFDDGEVPLEELITNIEDPNYNSYKRTFLLEDGKVVYKNNSVKQDYKQSQLGTPDYSDLLLEIFLII
jgi:hypothetical protein